ncbi:hypothetical protein HPC49_27440 [Pyxidicoccus fallax]|uniref:Uncharacterized protein n=2 Tax=Pyxidicoccus fallax TaxID=394095 RepID=A0A848LMK6_9BACT|nr:hypothetical protein [Pyxidicoccus fallax]NMO19028.1 hypothetical protein [Pyxidicoccus fallax]NPC81940.1 hypothetical protein [Pyxidicoccus fallax]
MDAREPLTPAQAVGGALMFLGMAGFLTWELFLRGPTPLFEGTTREVWNQVGGGLFILFFSGLGMVGIVAGVRDALARKALRASLQEDTGTEAPPLLPRGLVPSRVPETPRALAEPRAEALPTVIHLRPTRPRYRPGPLAVLVGAIVMGVLPLLLIKGWHPVFALYFSVGAVVALADWVWATRPRGSRATLVVGPHSVRVGRPGSGQDFPFYSLESLTLDERPWYRNGEEVALHRLLVLKGPRDEAALEHLAPVETDDVLRPGLERLVRAVTLCFEQRLTAGQSVRGEGWQLDAAALRCKEGVLPRSDLSGVGVTSAGVQVWRRGQAEPFLTVPRASANALPLLALLTRALPANAHVPDVLAEGLGHVLFRRRTSIVDFLLYVLFGLALVGGSGFMRWWASADWLSVLAVTGLGGLVLGAAWRLRPTFLTVHEGGLTLWRWPAKPVALRDDEVRGLGFSVTPLEVHGISVGQQYRLTVVAEDGRRIDFKNERRRPDTDLERVFQRLLPPVTEHLATLLEAGRPVTWGDAVLDARGLHVKLDGRQECFPLSRLRLLREERKLRVVESGGMVLVTLPEEAMNLHPVLHLLTESRAVDIQEEEAG